MTKNMDRPCQLGLGHAAKHNEQRTYRPLKPRTKRQRIQRHGGGTSMLSTPSPIVTFNLLAETNKKKTPQQLNKTADERNTCGGKRRRKDRFSRR